MKRFPIRSWLLISSLILLHLTGCGPGSRTVPVGEQFTLKAGEQVVVAGAGFAIQLKGIGHLWFVDGQGEKTIVELSTTAAGAESLNLTVGQSAAVGDYTITLKSADEYPSDRGPRRCDLVVTRR